MTVEWVSSSDPVAYDTTIATMEQRVAAIRDNVAEDMVWFLEHPALYTAGTSAQDTDLLDARFPVHRTGRGGQFTYHGPGQRVAYVMRDLARGGAPDLRDHIRRLEEWIILALRPFGIDGQRREGRVGIWVGVGYSEVKIAAIGVRVRRWVAYHGVAINRDPDLSHFDGIVPCGLAGYGVTSMRALLGRDVGPNELDDSLRAAWPLAFPD